MSTQLEMEKILTGDGEKPVIRLFLSCIRPGDVVFDIGANIGLFAAPAALRAGGTGRLVAFEPVHAWAERLAENLALNAISNATIHNIGLSSTDGTAEIHHKNVLGSGMATVMTPYENSDHEFRIETIRLARGDDLVRSQGLPAPNVVKIDVEGAEFEVMSGLRATLSDPRCRTILCEVHPGYLNVPVERLHRLLEELGFGVNSVSSRLTEYHVLARKQS